MVKTDTKSGFVALLGSTNVGKSTLINRLAGQKIAITSRKPQTTRNKILFAYTCKRGQIIFLDTPGIHEAKNKLGEYMVKLAQKSLKDADVALWLVDPIRVSPDSDLKIKEFLLKVGIPIILVINKCDKIANSKLPDVIKHYKNLGFSGEIMIVSAKHGINLDKLIEKIFNYLPYGPLYFDKDTITNQSKQQIVSEIIREKALRCIGDEIPHGIAVIIENMRKRPKGNIIDIEATVICEKNSHKGIIIGKNGAVLKKIGTDARKDIELTVNAKVYLKLYVKVRNRWRNNDILLKNYGFDKNNL